MDNSKKLLESILEETKEDHYTFIDPEEKFISSGSLILDSLIKVRSGSVIRIVGKGAELGKTSQCFVFAANYMATMPKSKTIFIKAESRLSEEMKKRSGHKFVYKPEDWDYGTVFVYSGNIFEPIANLLEDLLKQMYQDGENLCIILDSLDGLILKADLAKKIGGEENQKVAGVPLLTKLLFRRLGLPIVHYNALLLITGQYSADIRLNPYDSAPKRQVESAGGSSIGHQCDYVLSYNQRTQGDMILEDDKAKPDFQKNKTLGVYATIEVKKSASDVTGTKVKIPIKKGKIGCAIWQEKEIVEFCLAFEILTKKGAWFFFNEKTMEELKEAKLDIPEKFHGLANVYTFVENNPAVLNFFYGKFSNVI